MMANQSYASTYLIGTVDKHVKKAKKAGMLEDEAEHYRDRASSLARVMMSRRLNL